MRVNRALISVSDKRGITDLARGLVGLGMEIISTGGTAALLEAEGINVTAVSALTGFPEILGGRVKTLQPAIHGGILARRDLREHLADMERHGIQPIDMVVVNLYPFRETINRPGVDLEEVIENIDIGGPAMIRAAAKNHRHVVVVVEPDRYGEVLAELRQTGEVSSQTRYRLAVEAFRHTAQYDTLIAEYLGDRIGRGVLDLPATLCLRFEKLQDLRYGENPHQRAAFYRESMVRGPSLVAARQLAGKELSFNNINDAEAALRLALAFDRPTAVAVKHANPCGVGSGRTLEEAYRKAYDADPVSIFGGVLALNRVMDGGTAAVMAPVFLEVLVAPGYEEEALAVLAKKKDLRILKVPDWPDRTGEPGPRHYDLKKVRGGLLVQEADEAPVEPDRWRVVTGRQPTEEHLRDLVFAWRVVRGVKSNAIVLAAGEQTVGIGAGQMSRIEAARLAIKQAGKRARASVMASDAFFPFPDVVEAAAEAGVEAIVQPGGSVRDEESVRLADEKGIAMVFTGTRHFWH